MAFLLCLQKLFSSFSLAGLDERKCSVIPKDRYVEVGSSIEVMCQSWCVHGKIFWTLNNKLLDEGLSKAINSSHNVLSLAHITEPEATLQCHGSDTQQILGGTIITTYSKKYFLYSLAALYGYNLLFYVGFTEKPTKLSCMLHQTTDDLPGLLTCSWEHQSYSSLLINYSVIW